MLTGHAPLATRLRHSGAIPFLLLYAFVTYMVQLYLYHVPCVCWKFGVPSILNSFWVMWWVRKKNIFENIGPCMHLDWWKSHSVGQMTKIWTGTSQTWSCSGALNCLTLSLPFSLFTKPPNHYWHVITFVLLVVKFLFTSCGRGTINFWNWSSIHCLKIQARKHSILEKGFVSILGFYLILYIFKYMMKEKVSNLKDECEIRSLVPYSLVTIYVL